LRFDPFEMKTKSEMKTDDRVVMVQPAPLYCRGKLHVTPSPSGARVEVLITGNSSYPGAPGTGSQVGAALGRSAIYGNPLSAVGAIGGIMGAKAGASLDNQIGDKITIVLDSGKTVTIVQARDKKQPIMPGERVVIEGGSTTTVVREQPTRDPEYTAVKSPAKW
jgi:hypothetical protein